jgi:hypothetical protein
MGVEVDDQVAVGGVGTDDLGDGDRSRTVPGRQVADRGTTIA